MSPVNRSPASARSGALFLRPPPDAPEDPNACKAVGNPVNLARNLSVAGAGIVHILSATHARGGVGAIAAGASASYRQAAVRMATLWENAQSLTARTVGDEAGTLLHQMTELTTTTGYISPVVGRGA